MNTTGNADGSDGAGRPRTDGGETVDERDAAGETDRLHEAPSVSSDAKAGIVGGTVGTTLMTVAMLAVGVVYGPGLAVFRELSALTGAGENVVVGVALFFGAGALAWPMVFSSIGMYLPGRNRIEQGLWFALFLWIGFVAAFIGRYSGTDLALFVVFSIVSHAVYGWILGTAVGRLTGDAGRAEAAV